MPLDPLFAGAEARPVSWGPFLPRFLRLLMALAIGLLALAAGLGAFTHDRLVCAHRAEVAGALEPGPDECVFVRDHFSARALRLRLADVSGATVDRHFVWRGSKPRRKVEVGVLTIQAVGHTLRFAETTPARAEENQAALRSFLADPAAPRLTIATERQPGLLALAALAGVFCVCLAYSALAGSGLVLLQVQPDVRRLRVQRTWLGLPLGAAVEIPLPPAAEITDVRLEWAPLDDFFRSRGALPEWGARLVLMTSPASGPAQQPLTDGYFRGFRAHLRALRELRGALGLPAKTAAEEQAIERASARYRKQLAATWYTPSGRFGAAWLGACCGLLAGIFLGAVAALTVGGQRSSDPAAGPYFFGGALLGVAAGLWVALRATRRLPEP